MHLRVLETNQEVLKHVPDALIAVRRELELPINEAALRRMFAEQQAATLEVARRFLEHSGDLGKSLEAAAAGDSAAREVGSSAVLEERSGQLIAGKEVIGASLGPTELH